MAQSPSQCACERGDVCAPKENHSTTIAEKDEKDEKDRKRTQKTQDKDDWTINVATPPTIVVPSFIRLFVIRRIITNYIGINDHDKKIKQLVKVMEDSNTEQLSYNILHQLWKNGLKSYMKNYYNEKAQASTIEMIFNDIILKKFGKEYHNVTRYVNNNNNINNQRGYQCLLFNTNGLMNYIFEFLNFWNGELLDCTLVNFHWLYQIWNSPSLCSSADLALIIEQTLMFNLGDENACTRMWQRMVNIKSIDLDCFWLDSPNDLLLNRLCMLKKVQCIKCSLSEKHVGILKVLMQNCSNKIDRLTINFSNTFKFDYRQDCDTRMSPLKLMNANLIQKGTLCFCVTWSFKCQALILKSKSITKTWCEHVINNCDCCGIESLTLDRIYLAYSLTCINKTEYESRKLLLSRLAKKFANVKKLKVVSTSDENDYDKMKHFLELLYGTVLKNNGQFEFNAFSLGCDQKVILQKMAKNNVKVDALTMQLDYKDYERSLSIGATMNYVKLLKIIQNDQLLSDFTKINLDGKNSNLDFFPSLQVIEIVSGDYVSWMDDINKFLGSNAIVAWSHNGLFLCCNLFVRFVEDTDCDAFPILFGILHSLLVEKRIPIDIFLYWRMPQEAITPITNAYSLHLNADKISNEYQQPILNEKHKKFCQPFVNPIVKFSLCHEKDLEVYKLRIANARVIWKKDNVDIDDRE